jgi:hypothetical protein
MQVAIISSCTNRKKRPPASGLLARSLPDGPVDAVAREWVRRVSLSATDLLVQGLYAGRAFTEAVAASRAGAGGFHIVSAGLGLVSADDHAPSYNLTVAGDDEDNVLRKVTSGGARPTQWWTALTTAQGKLRPLSGLIAQQPSRAFVLALPSSYAELVADDLAAIPDRDLARVRIVGLPNLQKSLPQAATKAFVPYDERLEVAAEGRAGTRSDFPQRAARHFIEFVWREQPSASPEEHRQRVASFLSKLEAPARPDRVRYTDEMLKEVIRDLWDESEGRVTNGLRLLRRKRQIACEQSRFKGLFWEVAAELGTVR